MLDTVDGDAYRGTVSGVHATDLQTPTSHKLIENDNNRVRRTYTHVYKLHIGWVFVYSSSLYLSQAVDILDMFCITYINFKYIYLFDI